MGVKEDIFEFLSKELPETAIAVGWKRGKNSRLTNLTYRRMTDIAHKHNFSSFLALSRCRNADGKEDVIKPKPEYP